MRDGRQALPRHAGPSIGPGVACVLLLCIAWAWAGLNSCVGQEPAYPDEAVDEWLGLNAYLDELAALDEIADKEPHQLAERRWGERMRVLVRYTRPHRLALLAHLQKHGAKSVIAEESSRQQGLECHGQLCILTGKWRLARGELGAALDAYLDAWKIIQAWTYPYEGYEGANNWFCHKAEPWMSGIVAIMRHKGLTQEDLSPHIAGLVGIRWPGPGFEKNYPGVIKLQRALLEMDFLEDKVPDWIDDKETRRRWIDGKKESRAKWLRTLDEYPTVMSSWVKLGYLRARSTPQPLPDDRVAREFLRRIGGFWTLERKTWARLQAVRLAVAARAFAFRHGRWPDSLDEIRKEFFREEVILDPFTGKPFAGYARAGNGCRIWSVGPDLKDDIGKVICKAGQVGRWEKPLAGDIVVELAPAARGTRQ